MSVREAVRLIRAGDTVAIGGFFEIGLALEVIHELGALFEATDEESAAFGRPRDLTLVFCVSPGDWASDGANRLARPGLVKRIIGGHWSGVPALYQLVAGNQAEGYNMPLGPMSHLYRDIAAGKPGHLSRVGLGTFADPRFGGGKLNEMTTGDLVELVEIGGEEYLFYKAFPVNVAIIRGTTADPAGNITMEREALTCDTLSVAMAAHNCGGLVIAQVERLAEVNSLSPRQVKIPGTLVDCIVVATDPGNHPQTFGSAYNPAFAAEVRVPLASLAPMPLSARKIIARRAAMELRPNSVVNLGFGIPEGVASVAAEEKIADLMTLTAEPGAIGGIPGSPPKNRRRTRSTCPGAASPRACRPWPVRVTSVTLLSAADRAQVTRPLVLIRRTWWETRLRSQPIWAARTVTCIRPPSATLSAASTS